ncbi:hypothetical protein DFA_00511 [Cavenderia fasciculata]|uniref:Ubiquitin-like domain-containing protein n=1 Tax=Cavenderia fasciculata TaxID=261658 RepID=F4PSA4_CACFS|nr:uncharacterized protein DFA_00511 [Cavenderia fasciculata]EGG20650.1 hypothetical protein DFA_00511 [Cavenderia fasciculata]|eukprot:XP_004358500.1 hypothetical protein DFA_00511 [Cavenderia fasciculata]
MSLYFRVKRKEQTIFLSAENTDSIQKLKNDIAIINKLQDKPSDYVRLIHNGTVLDDKKTVNSLNMKNDDVVYLVYKNDDGSYEEIAASIL